MKRTWNIDPSHSSIVFGIRHLLIARVRGRLSRFGGVLELDEAHLECSHVRIDIEVASIDTLLEPRDAHLKSADFFDVEQFPTARFLSTSIERLNADYLVHGDLTLRGVTKPVTLKATFGGTATDARGRNRAAFSATTSLERAMFGLTWNQTLEAGGVAIGPTVDLEIDLQAILDSENGQ